MLWKRYMLQNGFAQPVFVLASACNGCHETSYSGVNDAHMRGQIHPSMSANESQ